MPQVKDDPKSKLPAYLDDVQPEFGPPDSEMVDEQDTSATQDELDQSGDRQVHLAALGQTLAKTFRDVETKRQPIEIRWLEDLRQHHGRYDPSQEKDLADAESCTLFLNVTKPKGHAFAARVMDMVLPTDDLNWGIEETPVPEIAGLEGDASSTKQAMAPPAGALMPDQPTADVAPDGMPGGQPQAPGTPGAQPAPGSPPANPDGTMAPVATPEGHPILEKDIVKAVKDEAKSRAEKMQDEIEDQLVEAKYNAVQRKAIDQMSKLGSGIIMGPVILNEWRVQWQPGNPDAEGKRQWERKLVKNVDKRPGVQWVDCWNFYPDMSANAPDEWGYAFVQYLLNPATFRKYAKQYNWMDDAVQRTLDGGARFDARSLTWMNELRSLSETMNFTDERYRVLRYYGEIDYEDLKACGADPERMGLKEGDHMCGVVWLCDSIVLKVDLNPLDSYDMPFSVCYCDKDEASPFGIGIPRLMRGEQESINAAWRMKHDNAGLSVCPQTVIRLNAVTPADGDYHMKPKKVWYVGDDVQDVNNVFAQFAIESHQEELDNILQLGLRFADDVTQLPLLMQGDQAPNITQTAQGMSLLYNASTVVLRRTVKFYDDYVTEPLITRFFEWNMQFNPRDDIKGDFRCVARGSSTLLDKEQQGQALDMAMQFAMQPTWQPYTDMKKLYKQALKAKRIPDIMLPDEEIDKNLKAQQEQAMAAAQAAAKPAPGAAQGMDPATQQLEQQKLALKEREIQSRDNATASAERVAIARIASVEKISLQDATAKFASIKVTTDAENQRFNAELATKQSLGTGI